MGKVKKGKVAAVNKGKKRNGSAGNNTARMKIEALCTDSITLRDKLKELKRVYMLKCKLICEAQLPYLEYIELREEICRLKAIKTIIGEKVAANEDKN